MHLEELRQVPVVAVIKQLITKMDKRTGPESSLPLFLGFVREVLLSSYDSTCKNLTDLF
jgi:uncharacterized protein YfaT (DUF1175 family)